MQFVAFLTPVPDICHFSLFLTATDPFIYGLFIKTPDASYSDGRNLTFRCVLADSDLMKLKILGQFLRRHDLWHNRLLNSYFQVNPFIVNILIILYNT